MQATNTTRAASKRPRRSLTVEQQKQALTKAVTGQSLANYAAIYEGFEAMGIASDDIKPRENVFTFNAWKALGRIVRKGQHGVRVVSVAQREYTDEAGEKKVASRPVSTTVFHISQTDAIN